MIVVELVVVLTTFKLVTLCVVRVGKMEEYNEMANREHLVCERVTTCMFVLSITLIRIVRHLQLVREQQSAVAL